MTRSPARLKWVGLIIACVLVVAAYTVYLPFGVDYLLYFRPPVEAWLSGAAELYDPVKTKGFFDMPWMAFGLAPFLLFRPPLDLALWRALNLAGVVVAAFVFRDGASRRWVALAAAHLYVLHAILVANVDGVILLGVGLAWLGAQGRKPWLLSFGLWLISFKPFNALLFGAVILAAIWRWNWREKLEAFSLTGLSFLWLISFKPFNALLFGAVILAAIWRWNWREKLEAFSLTGLSFLTSFFIFGPDWPARYLNNLKVVPPWPVIITTTWRAAETLGLPAWGVGLASVFAVVAFLWALITRGATPEATGLALATNLSVTTYAVEPHYILLIPAFLVVARRRPELAAAAYLLAVVLYALRAAFEFRFVWLAVLYPLILLAGSWYAVFNGWNGRKRSNG